jgi:hypothetical protein
MEEHPNTCDYTEMNEGIMELIHEAEKICREFLSGYVIKLRASPAE